MSPDLILLALHEGLKLANNIIEGIPVEERQKMWMENQKAFEPLRELLEKLFKALTPSLSTPIKPQEPK